MQFSSEQFYQNKLIAHESVKDARLCDMVDIKQTGVAYFLCFIEDTEQVLIFVDTSGCELYEGEDEGVMGSTK